MSEIRSIRKSTSVMKKYLLADNLVSKLMFIILVGIVFVLLLKFSTIILGKYFGPKNSPYIVKGLINGNTKKVISQNPKLSHSIPIPRSINKAGGIEFTYSVWLKLKYVNRGDSGNSLNHIFSKGSKHSMDHEGVYFPNNAPGLYFDTTISQNQAGVNNNLVIVMDTMNNNNNRITVKDIPLDKWICVVIRVTGNMLDVYINGIITKRTKLNSVPKQNYEDIVVCGGKNSGFDGELSSLRYYNYALSVNEINSLLNNGPNLNRENKLLLDSNPPYLSTDWYFYNDNI